MKSHAPGIRPRAGTHEFESRDGPSRGERVQVFLRRRHPFKTAANVFADLGGRVPMPTIKTWLQRGSAPDSAGYQELWLTYEADFLTAMAGDRSPQFLIAWKREREAAAFKAEIAALEAKLARVQS